MKEALLVIDYINEIASDEGKLVEMGFAGFIKRAGTLTHVNQAIATARQRHMPIIFVALAFDPEYPDHPLGSPLFGAVPQMGILKRGTWSAQLHPTLDYREGDYLIEKQRVNSFHNTELASTLEKLDIGRLYICGVATDFAVESAARDAHDRDFAVSIIADACAAANPHDHQKALEFLAKIADVTTTKQFVTKHASQRSTA
jgi:nicotinamidase-related amidase